MNSIRGVLFLSFLFLPSLLWASSGRDMLQQEMAQLEKQLQKAQNAQGPECAPEILAEAQACLAGVKEEFQEGDYWEAEDTLKRCRETSQGLQERILACAEDTDLDGVPNHKDSCPQDPEIYNGYKDLDGCPDRMPLRALLTADKIEILEPIRFQEQGQKILPSSEPVLEDVARILKENPDLRVLIEVHLDNRLPAETALRVSTERAVHVMAALTALGVQATRIETEGKGDREPIASNDSSFGRQLNQRVEFRKIP